MNNIQLGLSGILLLLYIVNVCSSSDKLYQMFNMTALTNLAIISASISCWSYALKNEATDL
jgi:hypothetical protein